VSELFVFIAGEGPTDIGELAGDPVYRSRRPREGFVQPVVRSLRPNDRVHFDGRKIMSLGRQGFDDLSSGLERQAAGAVAIGRGIGADAVLILHDVDREQGTTASPRERARQIQTIRAAIESGAASVAGGDMQGIVIGTPCRCIEAWVLGDVDAVESVARTGSTPRLSKPPEELWGAPNDPSSNHPKCVLVRIFGGDFQTDDYAAIGVRANIATMRAACPDTFEPFAAGVEAL